MPSLQVVSSDRPVQEMVDVLLKDGGVIIKDFLSPELMKEFEEQIAPLVEAEPVTVNDQLSEGGEAFVPPCTKRVFGLLGKTPSPISKVVMDPVWNALMSAGLSDSVSMYSGDEMITQKTGYLLSAAVAIQAMSGSSAQRLHRDQLLHSVDGKENSLYTSMVGCLIALNKVTKENGGTAVIPGSHLWPATRAPKVEECAYTEMEPGSALFTMGSVFHGQGANVTKEGDENSLRTLVAVFGCRDYYRQEENMLAIVPLDVARSLPEPVLRRCGWAKGAGGSGFVNHRHPFEYLGSMDKASVGFAV